MLMCIRNFEYYDCNLTGAYEYVHYTNTKYYKLYS